MDVKNKLRISNKIKDRFMKIMASQDRNSSARKKLRRAVTVLAALVVFFTTYMLILPAITIEKDVARELPGMNIASSSENVSGSGKEQTAGAGQKKGDQSGKTGTLVAAADKEKDSLDNSDGTDKLTENVRAQSREDHVGQTKEDKAGEQKAGTKEDSSEDKKAGTKEDQSEDEKAGTNEDPSDDKKAGSKEDQSEDKKAGSKEDQSEDQETESEEYLTEATTFTFEGEDYTVTAVADEYSMLPKDVTFTVKEIRKDVKAEKEDYQRYYEVGTEEISRIDGAEKKLSYARFFDISFQSGGEEVEPASPVELTIKLNQTKKSQQDAVEGTDNRTLKDDEKIRVLHFAENEGADKDVDGTNHDKTKGKGDAEAEIFPEEIDKESSLNKKDKDIDISFSAETFSVYGVVYTVDFTWQVDGEEYDFSIPGGGFVSLGQLVEALGIADDEQREDTSAAPDHNEDSTTELDDSESEAVSDTSGTGTNTEDKESEDTQEQTAVTLADVVISDKSREFLADVEMVEFSDSDLVWVGKVDDETTVGGLKKAGGLDCQYSDDLTEEQIDEINAQTVESGDWALISLQPFISKESLTVTMKDGEVFTVNVTDAQLSTSYLSDKGDLYEVTVTYDESAGIPEDASLKVTSYKNESADYSQIRDIILEKEEMDQADMLQALDISIVDGDGKTIEPEAAVRVELVIKNLADALEVTGDSLSVIHLDASSGDIQAEKVADAGDMGNIQLGEETATASFTLNSFSQFAITYGSYVKVNVHYVDVNGNELGGSTSDDTVSNNGTKQLSSYVKSISGYTYLNAHYGTYSGQVITSLKATSTPTTGSLKTSGYGITFYNGSTIVARQEYESSLRQVDVYLVYAPSTGYYIADTISNDGCLTVQKGTEVIQTGTDQNVYVKWYRSSDGSSFTEVKQNKVLNGTYNIPVLGGPKVNVSIDEGANKYYYAYIYKVEDNKEVEVGTTAVYHVPYYNDVQNGSFEIPKNTGNITIPAGSGTISASCWQMPNGSNGVIWKTTGTSNDETYRDIEIMQGADANGNGANKLGQTLRNYNFAFVPDGNQCAELNCEKAGALYQDVLTIPGAQLYWSLYHRARGAYNEKDYNKADNTNVTDTMYVVAMSTELAEKYDVTTQAKVLEVLKHVKDSESEFYDVEIIKITTTNGGNGIMEFMENTDSSKNTKLTIPATYFGNLQTDKTATATDERENTYTYGNTDWHYYTGNFSIPANQYLTRFFFVAGDTAAKNNTMGNFLDDINLSQTVPSPNSGQATVIIQKTVKGLAALPSNYATRIETTYEAKSSNSKTTTTDKNSDYDSYRTTIDNSGNSVSTASWTFPISIETGYTYAFTKGVETNPETAGKTDVVEGYSQTTTYVIKKKSSSQTEATVIAQESGKVIPDSAISQLTVNEKDVIYIEFINTYVPKYKLSIFKTDPNGNVISTGAAFSLYKAADFNDTTQKPKDNAEVIAFGTTGDNGILYLGELEAGEYRLLETKAPDGYNLPDSAITITVNSNGVTAMLGTSNLTVVSKGDNSWVIGQADGTWQINVWNNPGVELPSTGGPGTGIFTMLGSILLLGAGALLLMKRSRV